MVSCNLSDDTCVVSIYKRPMEKNLGSMKHLLLVGFLCFSGLVRFMRILPGSSLETPEVGCEVLKRGHVVFSIKQYANTMILIRFLDFCYYKMFYRVFSGPIGLYSSLPFRWNLGGDQELGILQSWRSSVSFWLSQGTKSSVAIQLQVMTWDLFFKRLTWHGLMRCEF